MGWPVDQQDVHGVGSDSDSGFHFEYYASFLCPLVCNILNN